MILDRILEHKTAELRRKKTRGYLTSLKGTIADRPEPLDFLNAVQEAWTPDSPALIAEVKKASPSQGVMRPEFRDRFDPVAIARTYQQYGTAAVSVLTDQDFFQGHLNNLALVKDHVGLPALNKEFIVDEVQLYESRAYGADAILLIVAALDRVQLEDLHAIARGLALDILFETHHEREVDVVLERIPDAILIGINNRDLQTFSTNLAVTDRLARRIPSDKFILSESGIRERADVLRIAEAGARAMLVGESLLRADDVGAKIRDLRGMTQETHETRPSARDTGWK
ncbi:MAG: indole-3-glycerol phosphate synthase TrpC [Nitrospira sp.]|nr:indole-3-glycerol phosphate synthase TrpC [Nitrospira sp.]MDD9860822.1 indole-3-glycerol phosphate synthase TrpC [Nitrospira sp.]